MEEVRKKLIRNLIIIGGIFVLVFIILILFQGCGNSKKLSYEKIEDKLKLATEKYLTKTNLFPSVEGEYVTISSDVLISNGYLKKFEDMTSDKNCFGQVLVQNNSKKYNYIVYLTCDNYKTKTIKDEITSKVVNSGDGVYEMNNEYIYRGEYVDNYLKLGNRMFRIIKITDDGYLKLISEKKEKGSYKWDDRYNINNNKNTGINDFEKSRIKEQLVSFYNDYDIFTEVDKQKIVGKNICIGMRNKNDYSFNNVECLKKSSEISYIDLPNSVDLSFASLDPNCNSLISESCTNYNYFANFMSSSWSAIGVNGTTDSVYLASIGNQISYTTNQRKEVNIIIYINANSTIDSGVGSKNNPYKIR